MQKKIRYFTPLYIYIEREIERDRKNWEREREATFYPSRLCGIWCPTHPTAMCGTRLFFGGCGHRAGAHTRPAFPKMLTAPSASPLLGAPQAPGNKSDPPKGVKSCGEGPLRPKEISRYRDTLGQIRAADNTVGRSATRQLERCRPILICPRQLCSGTINLIDFSSLSFALLLATTLDLNSSSSALEIFWSWVLY